MSTEIKAPSFPESVADGTIATWHKQPGEAVARDDLLADIETDKVVLEVLAPNDGVLKEIVKAEGETVLSEELIAIFEAGAAATAAPAAPAAEAPAAQAAPAQEAILSPAARKIADEKGLDPSQIAGTGKGGRVTKEDALKAAEQAGQQPAATAPVAKVDASTPVFTGERVEKRVPMTRLRKRVAERLVEAQQMTAMLTTFNEVNMKPVMELRAQYKDLFEKKHGVRMGFMGFFVKACVEALKRQPIVNASIDGNDVVYHGYQDIGVAVSSDRGLVVPVLRDTDNMGLANIESSIREYGLKARDGKLGIEDMTGGTFTISNGGVFGSLLSTPILNMPQSAILGMHKIQERPMAVNGKVEILPMMYLALSYDHRLLDGKEAVTFLVTIKDLLEDPARFLLEI
ncbi:2-oxoglutarate dehydrogenase complex dihydrolipoyllysine-residue succinyltransferase [Aestuariirhabdus sp. Z084]|uniref:2-oxoglutarate dehydrogenase complex dihydrolipoyllysine-residue succinyltransferase n=1 Tax=Aestuariirhabdus haliotis TaxID=2918751 RepID=UPI00201B3D6B|nr:2-oxoglutarate dehydrogenase complex dihydrolipoyllysine-residue succinyltransferase [Aestuariirhabdus haliotis]MCL6414511.1 2-oxoglutarate dehydrogenase complex dihydrolipoyllysine-residue succinyltransferase [Aestuariirhabdus haliotis]MCL6418507.1 2-oxoglutarate dehydrogenase complex dihydrolipoyllysine-residue succinyltransferase [Aestuariirhabdus haliotis]